MKSINVQIIPHKTQRYNTAGDWWVDSEDVWHIRVSKEIGDWRCYFIMAVHELTEMAWCLHNGIDDDEVSGFDIEFEKNRRPGNKDEPGEDPKAPYKTGHYWATVVELIVAGILGVNWRKYSDACERLM